MNFKTRFLPVAVLMVAIGLVAAAPAGAAKTVFAKKLTRILPQGKEPVLFEGGAFGPEGNFFFANVLAKPGGPKIIKLNPATKKWEGIHTDKTGLYTSTQFDSKGNLWVTDFSGTIDKLNPDGSGFTTTYNGKLATGADDLSFDPQGNMFVTDTAGSPWKPIGQIVRLNPQGKDPKTLMGGLASPSGISFTPDYEHLWVSEYTGQREDYLTLNKDHTAVAEAQV